MHAANAPRYLAVGMRAVDLTPAAVGPFVVPAVNLPNHIDVPNVNMVTCGGQATIPIAHAVASAASVSYVEIVLLVASASAGPGMRARTSTSSPAPRGDVIERVTGVPRKRSSSRTRPTRRRSCATRCSAYPRDSDEAAVERSVIDMVSAVWRVYVPGYRLVAPPQFDDDRSDAST